MFSVRPSHIWEWADCPSFCDSGLELKLLPPSEKKVTVCSTQGKIGNSIPIIITHPRINVETEIKQVITENK